MPAEILTAESRLHVQTLGDRSEIFEKGRLSLKGQRAVPEPSTYSGRGFLYVLALAGQEDLLKVGMTRDPLSRWSMFHPRWFEVFDLDHSLLVETETRADAQSLETTLHRALLEHQCPMPLTMSQRAGGSTEWYRGAYSAARDFVLRMEQTGYMIHVHAREWLGPAMATAAENMFSQVHHAYEDFCSGWLSSARLNEVRAAVDAQRTFGADIDALIPADIRHALDLGK